MTTKHLAPFGAAIAVLALGGVVGGVMLGRDDESGSNPNAVYAATMVPKMEAVQDDLADIQGAAEDFDPVAMYDACSSALSDLERIDDPPPGFPGGEDFQLALDDYHRAFEQCLDGTRGLSTILDGDQANADALQDSAQSMRQGGEHLDDARRALEEHQDELEG